MSEKCNVSPYEFHSITNYTFLSFRTDKEIENCNFPFILAISQHNYLNETINKEFN